MTDESFTYIDEDDGTQNLVNLEQLEEKAFQIAAEVTGGGPELHRRANLEWLKLRAETTPSYSRHVLKRAVEQVVTTAVFTVSVLQLPFVFERLRSLITTYRGQQTAYERQLFEPEGLTSPGDTSGE